MVPVVPVPTRSGSSNNSVANMLATEALQADQVDTFVASESTSVLEAVAELLGAELIGYETVEIAMLADESATVSYDVQLSWIQISSTTPVTSTERIIVLIGAEEPPETTAVFEHDGKHISIWRYPFDPLLPSMPSVLMTQGAFSEFHSVELHTYRPTKRAVASLYDRNGNKLFAKLMAPYRVTRTVENHERLAAHGVHVPEAWTVDSAPDVLLTTSVPGVGFATLIDHTNRGIHDQFDPDAVIAKVMEQISCIQSTPIRSDRGRVRPARRQPIRDLTMRVGQIVTIDPTTRATLEHITERIGTQDDDKNVMVHGDFHPGQLFLERLEPAGDVRVHIIDLDDVGYGHKLDDLAHLTAHLLIQQMNVGSQQASPWLAALLGNISGSGHNTWELTRRTAAHLVGLVIGSYRAQTPNWRDTLHLQLGFIMDLLRAEKVVLPPPVETNIAI